MNKTKKRLVFLAIAIGLLYFVAYHTTHFVDASNVQWYDVPTLILLLVGFFASVICVIEIDK